VSVRAYPHGHLERLAVRCQPLARVRVDLVAEHIGELLIRKGERTVP
jgi:hypothetical protein